ncbi:sialoadhesin-like [Anabas testudineus]|uniref:sialoadhesin-like n=1 Tax=Anabas testudineus TaxID=64144 RepID=UPI000E460FDE|nr:sialoadhesin-like [Anabas testudineus]
MFGFSHFLLSVYILGYIFRSSMAWEVKMPRHIKGLLNSCLVIPCTFDYDQNPPRRPDRVVWYQNVERGYPLVYDNWNPGQVIYAFRGKTERIYSTSKTCSLRIYPVTWSHHRQKIYPWVDPENIWSSTYRFFDTTVTIEVDSTPEKPLITVSGDTKVGQSVQLHCTVHHTCPTYPPTLTFNSPLRNGRVNHDCSSSGICKTTLTSTLDIKSDHESVTCSVRHTGGLTASTSGILNAEC